MSKSILSDFNGILAKMLFLDFLEHLPPGTDHLRKYLQRSGDQEDQRVPFFRFLVCGEK